MSSNLFKVFFIVSFCAFSSTLFSVNNLFVFDELLENKDSTQEEFRLSMRGLNNKDSIDFKKNNFFLSIGYNNMEEVSGSGYSNGRPINSFSFGGGYELRFNKRLSINTGLFFFNKPSSRTTYGKYGQTTSQYDSTWGHKYYDTNYSVSFNNLYFLEIPLNFVYRFNQKHSLGLGLNYFRLLTSKITISEIGENGANSDVQLITREKNAMYANSIGLNLSYEYRINRLGVNVGVTEWTGVLNRDYFWSTDGMLRLNFTLKYNL